MVRALHKPENIGKDKGGGVYVRKGETTKW